MPRLITPDFDQTNLWMFLIDYHFIADDAYGLINYERREPGCIIALFSAFRKMLDLDHISLLSSEINIEQVAAMLVQRAVMYHTLLASKVTGLNSANAPGKFRSASVHYGFHKGTSTAQGLEHLRSRVFVRGPSNSKIDLYYYVEEKRISCNQHTGPKTEAIFLELCKRLVEDLRALPTNDSSENKSKKLAFIGEFLQDAMALHPFGDANNRTLVIILLNDILLSLGETPMVFFEANVIDAFDIKAMVQEMLDAQHRCLDLCQGKVVPKATLKDMLLKGFLHLACGAGEVELTEKLFAINPDRKNFLLFERVDDKIPLQLAASYAQEATTKILMREMQLPPETLELINILFSDLNSATIDQKITTLRAIPKNIVALLPASIFKFIPNSNRYLLLCLLLQLKLDPESVKVVATITSLLKANNLELSQVVSLALQAAKTPEAATLHEYFLETGLALDFSNYKHESLQMIDPVLKDLFVVNALYANHSYYVKSYVSYNYDVAGLFKLFALGKKVSALRGQVHTLPLCIDIFFVLAFVKSLDFDTRAEFFTLFLTDEFVHHVCIDVNSIVQLAKEFVAQQHMLLEYFALNPQLLENTCQGRLDLACDLICAFNATNRVLITDLLQNCVQNRLNNLSTKQAAVIISDLVYVREDYKDYLRPLIQANDKLYNSLVPNQYNSRNNFEWLRKDVQASPAIKGPMAL